MSELEEEYNEGLEREGEIFLEGLKNNKSLEELEKQYSKKVKEIRRIYEKSLKKELYKEKFTPKETKNKKTEENTKEFKAEGVDLEKSWVDKKKIETESVSYKFSRRLKNFFNKITPNKLIYLSHRLRLSKRSFFKEVRNLFKRIFEKVSTALINTLSYIKGGFMKVVLEVKKLFSLFSRKKKKEKDKNTEKEGEIKKEEEGNENKEQKDGND